MRIIQAIWTKPMLENANFYQHMRLAYVSAKSIKAQGYQLILYTDKSGLIMFKDFPYDEIIEINMDEFNPRLFATPKYLALEKEPLGSVHLDYDIILTKPCIKWNEGCDALTQYEEVRSLYMKEREFVKTHGTPTEILKHGLSENPYCFGTIGFNNQELKDAFINHYKEAMNMYKNIDIPSNITVDFLLEQAFLPKYVSDCKYNPQFVIDGLNGCSVGAYRIMNGSNLRYVSSDQIGYHHFHGGSKWTEMVQEIMNDWISQNDIRVINRNYMIVNKTLHNG